MSNVISRGELWLETLVPNAKRLEGLCPSVQVADGELNGEAVRFIAVVPDAHNHYPRAAKGEVGLLEGWTLAKVVSETIAADADKAVKRPIVAVIDVASQAYGRREEGFGIHQALAGAAAAYANARLAGHPVIGLIVGKAMSGAFLAHGYQANRLIAFNDSGVLIHAMGKESAARITLRTVASLEKLAATIPPMAYDISNYATLGLLENLLDISNPDAPSANDLALVKTTLQQAINDARQDPTLKNRLGADNRRSSALVRERMRASW
ncbi:biotin-independent malonate decarboxylase subunit gamma [Salmonella enterica subsp. salamae]|uniref:Biotin-independent malonate decarboxylase subunit gamma n=1 Tax=Salmonella enterica subsp. salamae TaxID=59202 RepID=A0A5Y3X4I4_SALER|nr:biotin-independent malonate decarboxylase subunit gamma [Salmonella enterica]ECG8596550.1 biotin-independent malonate decarboxylase subunit gamma [Salmonella enterica subsp. salamae]HCM1921382.1 biotin-independent malonate decarboxylase subunit gamma [Salmonella enterica subsp. salamae serovar 16:m,t:e,n,x]ECI4598701.1 biotin-independent malonate decarboxylase subunit gamma [Salmonella enterica subsp. salamae]ECJ4505346.1 biotin-independent malonate decarboxylase subunit gamma [Salmonella en